MTLPCVILAGGLATRMRPLTERIPKTLLEVAGRPFADLQLAWLRGQGVAEVVYCIGFLGDMVRAHVGNGSRHGLRVTYVDEGEDLRGTAGALRLALDRGGVAGDAFLVLNGDSYLDVAIPAVERAFRVSGLPALMTVFRNRDRWDQSNVVLRDGRIAVYDKDRPAEHRAEMEWIDYGLSVMHRSAILDAVPSGAVADVADVMRDLSRAGRLAGFEATVRFYEIGSPEGLRALEERLRGGSASGTAGS